MPWFFIILFLCFTLNHLSEADHNKKLSSAILVGTVYCDTCFQEDFSKNSHFISGASVAVECKDDSSRPSFHQEVKTNEHGEFRVHLPFSVGKHVRKIKKCSVQLLSSSEPYCAVASTATSSSLRLKSRKQGIHIFSAGFFSFKPQKQPFLCNQKPSTENSENLHSRKISAKPDTDSIPSFSPSVQDPNVPNLPPVNPGNLPPLPVFLLPLPPLPQLPPLPPLPSLPTFPPSPGKISKKEQTSPENFKKTQESDNLSESETEQPNFLFPPLIPTNPLQPPSVLPPNPLQPPTLIPPLLPPNPLQPPPLLPPNPLQPPPSPLIPLPPIPGITPSPPPPIFLFPPLPPVPLPPLPRIPGIPPASSSTSSSTSQKPSP